MWDALCVRTKQTTLFGRILQFPSLLQFLSAPRWLFSWPLLAKHHSPFISAISENMADYSVKLFWGQKEACVPFVCVCVCSFQSWSLSAVGLFPPKFDKFVDLRAVYVAFVFHSLFTVAAHEPTYLK